MARKPNYRFERQERERRKAAKKAEKLDRKRGAPDEGGDGIEQPEGETTDEQSLPPAT